MRKYLLMATVSLLGACGGGGGGSSSAPNSAGSAPPPAAAQTHSFANPTEARTYQTIGGVHSFSYDEDERRGVQTGQLYAGNATTARNSGITIAYDPRDAIFQIEINDGPSGVSKSLRYQDPLHRTAFGGAQGPQPGTPNLTQPGIAYLQAGNSSGTPGTAGFSSDVSTFFGQKPGTSTKYVTFAGYVRNTVVTSELTDPIDQSKYLSNRRVVQRGAFAYGERTRDQDVPKGGSGTYQGAMIASMVYNPNFDNDPSSPTFFQWIEGSAQTKIDFGANKFEINLNGSVQGYQNFDDYTADFITIPAGAAFTAHGAGNIDLLHNGGFLGSFDSASVGGNALNIAGSSVDGAFYGPAAAEVGGGFRIVGGVPDQRVDILGTFVGAK